MLLLAISYSTNYYDHQDCHAWRLRRTPIFICRVMARRVDKLLSPPNCFSEMGYVYVHKPHKNKNKKQQQKNKMDRTGWRLGDPHPHMPAHGGPL